MSSPIAASGMSSPLSSAPVSRGSSPLSDLGRTPSPPPVYDNIHLQRPSYPSPPASSQTSSQRSTPTPQNNMTSVTTSDRDGPPLAKRRRISKEPKERVTQHIDIREGPSPEQEETLQRVMNVLHNRRKIVVIAGAGMSVSAGIPDFRSSTGLFKSLKGEHKLKGSGKDLFDASVYKDDRSTSSFHSMISSMSQMTKVAQPTVFHHMLATIAKEDRLLRLYSQNIDGIDTGLEPLATCVPLRKDKEGKWPRTIQLHGGLDKMVCSKCGDLQDFDADLFSGPTPPACHSCLALNQARTEHAGKRSHGIGRLRPRMVLYNEHNPDDEAIGSVTREDLRKRPDAVIVVGTTLKVPGVRRIVREMCGVVRDRRDGVAIWVNNNLPPVSKDLENCFDIIVQGSCDEVALRAAMPNWDQPADEQSAADVREAAASLEINKGIICLPASQTSSTANDTGLLTPVPEIVFEEESLEVPTAQETGIAIVHQALIPKKKAAVKKIAAPKSTVKKAAGRPRSNKKKGDTKPNNQLLTFAPTKAGINVPSSQVAKCEK